MVYHHGKFLFAETDRIAMRENGTLTWLISDHLGSTSVTADANGNLVSSLRYTAFGEVRAASGAMEQVTATPVSAAKPKLDCITTWQDSTTLTKTHYDH